MTVWLCSDPVLLIPRSGAYGADTETGPKQVGGHMQGRIRPFSQADAYFTFTGGRRQSNVPPARVRHAVR